MNKNTKITIIETIKYLLALRYDLILGDNDIPDESKAEFVKMNLMTTHSNGTVTFVKRFITGDNIKKIENLDNQLVKLNRLLPYFERDKETTTIDQQMMKIQAKRYITVKEFADIYNISTSSQRDYRSRRIDEPLPYHQKVAKGKIVYVIEEVEKWFKNQYK